MNRAELERSWGITKSHFEAALRLLPVESPTDEILQARARYREWLDHNELELALDELMLIGDELAANGLPPPAQLWSELAAAAANMKLEQKAALCRQMASSKSSQ